MVKKPMFTKLFNQFLGKIVLFILIIAFVNQCGMYRKTDARKVPVNAKERVKKNLEEGRRIKFGQLGSKGSGNFEFATSNEMWRATVDILDFMPLANADYGGGVIITDWYSYENKKNESIKIMVQFLSNEIRADGLKVIVYNKTCEINNQSNCSTTVDNSNNIGQELKLAILKKAAVYKTEAQKKEKDDFNKNRRPINRDRAGQD